MTTINVNGKPITLKKGTEVLVTETNGTFVLNNATDKKVTWHSGNSRRGGWTGISNRMFDIVTMTTAKFEKYMNEGSYKIAN